MRGSIPQWLSGEAQAAGDHTKTGGERLAAHKFRCICQLKTEPSLVSLGLPLGRKEDSIPSFSPSLIYICPCQNAVLA